MNTAEITDKDYRPSRDEVLGYSQKEFSQDISNYILKLKDNEDLKLALLKAWEWDRDLVIGRLPSAKRPDWKLTVTSGDCMKELIYKLGCIVYANFLAHTEAE